MNRDVSPTGLPWRDRCLLALANWALGGLSPMAQIRWRWHLLRERGR